MYGIEVAIYTVAVIMAIACSVFALLRSLYYTHQRPQLLASIGHLIVSTGITLTLIHAARVQSSEHGMIAVFLAVGYAVLLSGQIVSIRALSERSHHTKSRPGTAKNIPQS